MPLTVTRLLLEGTAPDIGEGESFPIFDEPSGTLLGYAVVHSGTFSFPLPLQMLLAGRADGHGAAVGAVGSLAGGGAVAAAGGGQAGGSASLSQAIPLGGAAGGQAAGAGGPGVTGSQQGAAGGDAEAQATLRVSQPLGGAAGGAAGAGPAAPTRTVFMGGAAGGAAGAGPATEQTTRYVSGAAGGQAAGAAGTPSQAFGLSGSAGGTGATSSPTPTITGGGSAVSVSDDFNRANGGLGSNWTTFTGASAPQIANNEARNVVNQLTGAVHVATPNANQFAASRLAPGAVRMSPSASTCYYAQAYDDGEGGYYVDLIRRVAGSDTVLTTFSSGGWEVCWRLEVSGDVLTLRNGTSQAALTTVGTYTDSSGSKITSGRIGFLMPATSLTMAVDDWSGGDL